MEIRAGAENHSKFYHVTVTRPQIVTLVVPTQIDEESKKVTSPALQCQANLGFPNLRSPDQPRYSSVSWYLSPEDKPGNTFMFELIAEKFINLRGTGEYLAVPPEIDDAEWKARDEELINADKLLKHFMEKSEKPYVVVDDATDQAVIVKAILARQRKYAKEVVKDPSLPQKLAA